MCGGTKGLRLIVTHIKIPVDGWLPKGDTIERAVHLYCPWNTVAVGQEQPENFFFGRDYLLAVSRSGFIWGLHGDRAHVRSMHPKAKEVRWSPRKNLKLHIQHLQRKGYRVVGEMDSDGVWRSEYFTYPPQPLPTARKIDSPRASLQELYPLSQKIKIALEGVTGPEWF